jgi:hypothetical protein
MPRRFALAVALAFTIVVSYSLIVVGASSGLFDTKSKPSEAAQSAGPAVPPRAVAEDDEIPPPTPSPVIVTEYIYVDVPVARAPAQQPATVVPQPTSTAPTSVPLPPAPVSAAIEAISPSLELPSAQPPASPKAAPSQSPSTSVTQPSSSLSSGSREHEVDDHEHEDD